MPAAAAALVTTIRSRLVICMDLSPLPVLQVGLTILRIKSSPFLFVSPKKAAEQAPTCFDRAFIFCWRLLPVLNIFAVLFAHRVPPMHKLAL